MDAPFPSLVVLLIALLLAGGCIQQTVDVGPEQAEQAYYTEDFD